MTHRMPGRRLRNRLAIAHEHEGEHQHARHREEHGRVDQLAAAPFDAQILPGNEPGVARETHAISVRNRPAISRAERAVSGERPDPAVVEAVRRVHQPIRTLEIVRGDDDDGAGGAQRDEPRHQGRRRRIVEAGEGLVEKHEPRTVDERTFQRQALPQASREAVHAVVSAIRQPRGGERLANPLPHVGHAVERREELEVLPRRQVAIEEEVVPEDADVPAQAVTQRLSQVGAVANLAARRPDQRRQHSQERRLASAIGPEEPCDLSGFARERDTAERPPAAELP